jgi:hypothetical protein
LVIDFARLVPAAWRQERLSTPSVVAPKLPAAASHQPWTGFSGTCALHGIGKIGMKQRRSAEPIQKRHENRGVFCFLRFSG